VNAGSALTSAFAVVAVILACAGLGFYIGRNILGEQYLKLSAAKIRPLPAPQVQPRAAPEPPVIDEPASLPEPEKQQEESPRRRRDSGPQTERPSRATPAASDSSGTVTLRLGSFLKADNAKNLVRDLRNRGYSPTVTLDKEGETPLHRVQMGPLPPDRARALAAELERQGYDVGVVQKK
jgi:cell division septation protein DedD